MNILIITESFVIKEGLEKLFKSLLNNVDIKTVKSLMDVSKEELLCIDFMFIEIKDDYEYEFNVLKYIKFVSKNLKVIVLDRIKSTEIFELTIKYGIEGYILNISGKEEFIYTINKILAGKKVYESDVVENLVNSKKTINMEYLSKREKDVLCHLAKGLDNKAIASILYITEHTVKKHVSNILCKLNLKNRQEVIIYMSKR